MARYAVVALFLLALFMIPINVFKISSEVADIFRPRESNRPGDEVRDRTCDDDLDDNYVRPSAIVTQCDAGLLFFWTMYLESPQGSARKAEARKMLVEEMLHTMRMEDSVTLVGNLLFGTEKGPEVLKTSQPDDLPFVDDWNCFRSLVKVFTTHCGSLRCTANGFKSIANICNAGNQGGRHGSCSSTSMSKRSVQYMEPILILGGAA